MFMQFHGNPLATNKVKLERHFLEQISLKLVITLQDTERISSGLNSSWFGLKPIIIYVVHIWLVNGV